MADARVTRAAWVAEFNGLRAVFCLFVVLAHFPFAAYNGEGWQLRLVGTVYYYHLAQVGTFCFFILSAFLLSYLAVREHRETGRFDLPRFYLRRMLRIWPLYFLA